jgi:ABC-type glycerol-3-phosphate transport system permease component
MTMSRVFLRTGAIVLLALWAFPIYWMVVASITPEARLFSVPSLLPEAIVLDHYRALFAERQFWLPVRNSLVVAAATTVLALAVGIPAAYAVARLRFRGRSILLAAVLAISVFPQISIVSPLFLLLRSAG